MLLRIILQNYFVIIVVKSSWGEGSGKEVWNDAFKESHFTGPISRNDGYSLVCRMYLYSKRICSAVCGPPIPRRFWKFRIYHSGRDVKVWNDASKKSVSPKICGWTGDAKEGFEVHHARPLTRQPLPAVDDDIHETISKVRSRLGGSE